MQIDFKADFTVWLWCLFLPAREQKATGQETLILDLTLRVPQAVTAEGEAVIVC